MKTSFTRLCTLLFFFVISQASSFGQQRTAKTSTLTATLSGATIKEVATHQITAYNVIRSGNVSYTAGQTIILEHGFQVADGAQFSAQIEPVEMSSPLPELTETDDPDKSQLDIKAYPNPFAENTQLEYWLPKESKVRLAVYDAKGVQVGLLIDNQVQAAGNHKVTFESKYLPSGIYSCIVATPNSKKVQKVFKH